MITLVQWAEARVSESVILDTYIQMRGSVQYVGLGVVETAGEARACGKRCDGTGMFNAWQAGETLMV
jgi:hypothetical protein